MCDKTAAAPRENNLKRLMDFPESHGHDQAVSVFFVPYSLDSGYGGGASDHDPLSPYTLLVVGCSV